MRCLQDDGSFDETMASDLGIFVALDPALPETFEAFMWHREVFALPDYALALGQSHETGDGARVTAGKVASGPDAARCLAAGCDDFVVKPATRDALVSACSYWLRGSSTEAA